MNAIRHFRHTAIHGDHPWKILAINVGAVASIALSQLATASVARADNFTDIFDNVQFAIGQGQGQLGAAAADFANSDPAQGLTMTIAGLDNLGIAAQEDAFVGTVDALAGQTPFDTFFGLFPSGLDPAAAMADAQGVISDGQDIFSQALVYFGNGDFVDGLTFSVGAYNDIFVTAPDFLYLGFVDSLLGL
nr:MetaGeneMark_Unknown Function [uncultured bacterium]